MKGIGGGIDIFWEYGSSLIFSKSIEFYLLFEFQIFKEATWRKLKKDLRLRLTFIQTIAINLLFLCTATKPFLCLARFLKFD